MYVATSYYYFIQFSSRNGSIINYVTIDLDQIKIPISFRYKFPGRNIAPFIDLGVSNTVHLNSKSHWHQEREINNRVEFLDLEAFILSDGQLGLWGGVGVVKSVNNRFNTFAEVRFERTNGIEKRPSAFDNRLSTRVTNFQIVLGIRTK